MKRSKPEKFMKGVYFVATAAMVVPMAMAVNPTKDPSEWQRYMCSVQT
jgi:hypothetical protein